jgi:hypothetical protein
MNVHEAIAAAEAILPGQSAAEGEEDARWQAIIAIGDFVESDPEPVWAFVERWGKHPDDDLRAAIATCLLEHLLEHHFDSVLPRVERLARSDRRFAETLGMCWRFGQSKLGANAFRLASLVKELQALATKRGRPEVDPHADMSYNVIHEDNDSDHSTERRPEQASDAGGSGIGQES